MSQVLGTHALSIYFFGPFKVLVGGVSPSRRLGRKPAMLLALLALQVAKAEPPIERGWLAETLCPDRDPTGESMREPDSAQKQLDNAVWKLRVALGNQASRLVTGSTQSGVKTLTFDISGDVYLDILDFDRALRSEHYDSLLEAVNLYGGSGPFLAGWELDAFDVERAARAEQCLIALHTLARQADKAGDYEAAADFYRRAEKVDINITKVLYHEWMEVQHKRGDKVGIRRVFRILHKRLREVLIPEPDSDTKDLHDRLCAEVQRGNIPPRPYHLQKTPLFATKPEENVVPNDVPDRMPTLPQPLTPFIGRQMESERICGFLITSRLVTITGEGGIGKSRLLLHVGDVTAEAYPDGVYYIEFTETDTLEPDNAEIVLATIVRKCGIPEASMDAVVAFFAFKCALLILDNCEQFVEPCAFVIGRLLQETLQLRILLASRVRLSVRGQKVYRVPHLALPPRIDLPVDELRSFDAVQLFEDQARQSQEDFLISDDNASLVAEICHNLGGIPLAIELAAAGLLTMDLDSLAREIKQRIWSRTGSRGNGKRSNQTLYGAIDWSFRRLLPEERVAFRRLSVFVGSWTRAAAREVVPGAGQVQAKDRILDIKITSDDLVDLIDGLVSQSMVQVDIREDNEYWYRILPPLRTFGAEQLESAGETAVVRQKCLAYYEAMAQHVGPLLSGSDQGKWLALLDKEYDNIKAVLTWCRAEPAMVRAGIRLMISLWRFYLEHGHASEIRPILAEILTGSSADSLINNDSLAERARGLSVAGALAYHQSDYPAAEAAHWESLHISESIGNQRTIASCWNNLGNVAKNLRNYEEAKIRYRNSLSMWQQLKATDADDASALTLVSRHIATILCNLGLAEYEQDEQENFSEAQEHIEEARAMFTDLNDIGNVAEMNLNLGHIASASHDPNAARERYSAALSIFESTGNNFGIARARKGLADVLVMEHKYGVAVAEFAMVMEEFSKLEYVLGLTEVMHIVAVVLVQEHRWEPAVILWGANDALLKKLKTSRLPANEKEYQTLKSYVLASWDEDLFKEAWENGGKMDINGLLQLLRALF